MSEIKYINLEDDRLWEILFDEACVEGGQAERIQKELEKIAIDEKEITRKPMQEIVERLEEEKEKSLDRFVGGRCNGKTLQMGINYGIEKTIRIVKEVGGMNENHI